MNELKQFPEGMVPLGESKFAFSCHPGVKCFTLCCKNVDMILYPYDIIRMKNALGINSSHFMEKFTRLVKGENPFFPTVMLKLSDNPVGNCPFLHEFGCSVYSDRPSACRMYPLERAVDRKPENRKNMEYYFLTRHDYCLGHQEEKEFSVRQWIRDQRQEEYNTMNELWTEMDTLFASNPWQGEGSGGSKQQLAFMVCYDIDGFRKLVQERGLVEHFSLTKDIRRRISENDIELMKFGFEWLKFFLTGRSSLVKK